MATTTTTTTTAAKYTKKQLVRKNASFLACHPSNGYFIIGGNDYCNSNNNNEKSCFVSLFRNEFYDKEDDDDRVDGEEDDDGDDDVNKLLFVSDVVLPSNKLYYNCTWKQNMMAFGSDDVVSVFANVFPVNENDKNDNDGTIHNTMNTSNHVIISLNQKSSSKSAPMPSTNNYGSASFVAIHPTSKRYNICCLLEEKFFIYDVERAEKPLLVEKGSTAQLTCVDWSYFADNQLAITSSSASVKVVDLRLSQKSSSSSTSSIAWKNSGKSHNKMTVRSVKWSPLVEYWLATTGDDGDVCIWDIRMEGIPMSTLSHEGPVLSVAWSPTHSDLLASTGCDTSLRLWNLSSSTVDKSAGILYPDDDYYPLLGCNFVASPPTFTQKKHFSNLNTINQRNSISQQHYSSSHSNSGNNNNNNNNNSNNNSDNNYDNSNRPGYNLVVNSISYGGKCFSHRLWKRYFENILSIQNQRHRNGSNNNKSNIEYCSAIDLPIEDSDEAEDIVEEVTMLLYIRNYKQAFKSANNFISSTTGATTTTTAAAATAATTTTTTTTTQYTMPCRYPKTVTKLIRLCDLATLSAFSTPDSTTTGTTGTGKRSMTFQQSLDEKRFASNVKYTIQPDKDDVNIFNALKKDFESSRNV